MNSPTKAVEIALRIPGNWSHPGELLERLPEGYRLTPELLVLPSGLEVDFNALQPDDQFSRVFKTACRRPATEDETEIVNTYTVNICLSGPGGSMDAAKSMMQAAAAIVHAGGAGVFIDNSALAHGGEDWTEMADDGGPDAVSFAYVSVIRGPDKIWTMGMHTLGFPDIEMEHVSGDGDVVIEVLRYICSGDHPIGDGHILADEVGPRFTAAATGCDTCDEGSPMYNPWGRLRLKSMKRIAESN